MTDTGLTKEEIEGPGTGPMFEDDEVKEIVERLLPLLASASQTERSAQDEKNVEQLEDVCGEADRLSFEVAKLTEDGHTEIATIAGLADGLKAKLSPDRTWSIAQRLTMVEMAIRMRRYARTEPGSLALFIQDIRDRVDTRDKAPIVHW